MPEPIKRGQRYMPGLDGLRAIAVLGVIAYHFGFGWAGGGLLGVGVFFTLSGYLITDILLAQVAQGGIRFKDFYMARARRLFPALFVMLLIVIAWVTVIGPHQNSDFRGSTISAIFYVNNWYLVFHDVSYFARFAAPSPLNHLWSLSVEEQFYIVWPFLLLIGIKLIPEVKFFSGVRFRLAGATLGLALASAILMAILYKPSIDPSRVYYGTDTRALELLIGAALAMIWPSRKLRQKTAAEARRVLDALGGVGLLVVFLMFWQSSEFSHFLYRGGFLLLSVATALAVGAMVHPASKLGPIVGCKPMRWIGERSYGIYLWHFPIIVLTTPDGAHGIDMARIILQFAAIIGVAALSWHFVENPSRHGAIGRIYKDWKRGRWRREPVPRQAWAVMAVSAIVGITAIVGLAGVGIENTPENAVGSVDVTKTVRTGAATTPAEDGTLCTSVVHVGDSTSEGLVSTEYNPTSKLISAQYARVGAPTTNLEVSGARSIYEEFEGQPNAHDAAQVWKDKGFDGCWVLALGTNEAANVSAGSTFGYDERIASMMEVAGDQPTLWVNVKSLLSTGPYAEQNMKDWDEALLAACDNYPHMRIYDWADDVRDDWFIDDGIHFTSEGYAARGRLIADALYDAFPNDEPLGNTDSDNCVIHPTGKELPVQPSSTGVTGATGASGATGATGPNGATTDPSSASVTG